LIPGLREKEREKIALEHITEGHTAAWAGGGTETLRGVRSMLSFLLAFKNCSPKPSPVNGGCSGGALGPGGGAL
jgi:hypothetical protein